MRRLVAGASVFGNAEKAAMVLRLLMGLGATGVDRVLMLPAGDGLSSTLRRYLHAAAPGLPRLEEIEITLEGTARDTTVAVERMLGEGVRAIVVLGGDGTHRIVAKACGEVPVCAISTGTNNVFPEMRETTVAGMAVGLVATDRAGPGGLRRESALAVTVAGAEPDLALVDVAVSSQRFVASRAVWRPDGVSELFVTFASPAAVGLSAIAGALEPVARGSGRGLHVRLAPDGDRTVLAAIAPGLVVPVRVASHRVIELDEPSELAAAVGTISLDGERELERLQPVPATVRLVQGPYTIDIDAALART